MGGVACSACSIILLQTIHVIAGRNASPKGTAKKDSPGSDQCYIWITGGYLMLRRGCNCGQQVLAWHRSACCSQGDVGQQKKRKVADFTSSGEGRVESGLVLDERILSWNR